MSICSQRRVVARLRRKVRELEKENAILREESVTDFLTRVYNRRGFENLVRPVCRRICFRGKREKKNERPHTLVYFDVNKFKRVNDEYGHEAGDSLLRQVAAMMRKRVRPTDVAGRVGGDEFLLFLPETSEEEAHFVAQDIAYADVGPLGDIPLLSYGIVDVRKFHSYDEAVAEAETRMRAMKKKV